MNPTLNKKCELIDLGKLSYAQAWDYQTKRFEEVLAVKWQNRESTPQLTPNYLITVEHPPVYTLGKSGDPGHLLLNIDQLQEHGIEFFPVNRGGDITFHGPGQWVVYPIFDLENFFTDIHRYLRTLEEVVMATCSYYGVTTQRIAGLTGVWTDKPEPKKICAMGVKTSRWVTMHGLALNVNTDLAYFNHIIPCGIADRGVTSLQAETGAAIDFGEVRGVLVNNFQKLFNLEFV